MAQSDGQQGSVVHGGSAQEAQPPHLVGSGKPEYVHRGLFVGGGTAVSNFLITLGIDSSIDGQIGSGIDGVIGAIQGAVARVRTAINVAKITLMTGGSSGEVYFGGFAPTTTHSHYLFRV